MMVLQVCKAGRAPDGRFRLELKVRVSILTSEANLPWRARDHVPRSCWNGHSVRWLRLGFCNITMIKDLLFTFKTWTQTAPFDSDKQEDSQQLHTLSLPCNSFHLKHRYDFISCKLTKSDAITEIIIEFGTVDSLFGRLMVIASLWTGGGCWIAHREFTVQIELLKIYIHIFFLS